MLITLLFIFAVIIWISIIQKINRSNNQIDKVLKEIEIMKKLFQSPPKIKEQEIHTVDTVAPIVSEDTVKSKAEASQTETIIEETPTDIPPIPVVEQVVSQVEEIIPETTEEITEVIKEEAEYQLPTTPPPLPKPDDVPPIVPTIETIPPHIPFVRKEKAVFNYERFIGENLFGKIGILILVIGIGFFVKYAIDNNWINEVLRTILGFTVGAVLLVIAWFVRKKYRAFSSVLAGGGFAVFYVTVAIAYHYYELFSQAGAFIILVVLTVLMSLVAIWNDRRELAMIALVGGFLAPFLVSSGTGNYQVLFTYVLILDLGMLSLSLFKKWGELPIACFVLTWLTFAIYLFGVNFSTIGNTRLIHLQIFAVLFYLIFQASVAPIVRINRQYINQLLLIVIIVNNFVFLYFGLTLHWAMLNVSEYGGAITLFAALVNVTTYFWLYKRGERFPFLRQASLWLALTFFSITFPIQLEGSMITVFWASELILIMLLYTRFRIRAYEVFSLLLFALTIISYLIDVNNMFDWGASPNDHIFLNGHFFTGLLVGISFLASAFILQRTKDIIPPNAVLRYSPFNAILLISGTIVIYFAFIIDFYLYIDEGIFAQTLMRVFTMVVLFLLTWLYHSRFAIRIHTTIYMALLGISVIVYALLSSSVNHTHNIYPILRIFQWFSLAIVTGHGIYMTRTYYRGMDNKRLNESSGIILYISILFTVLMVITTYNLLSRLSLTDEANAGLSVSLGLSGFILMSSGMKLDLKALRIVSLFIFGLVLLKLVVVDLWLLPTVGKIIVFILLGIFLLVLSFLYQKLKAVLFDDNKNSEDKIE